MDSFQPAQPLQDSAVVGARRLRRHHYRHQIHSLAYFNLDQANGGILRNLAETGIAVQAVAALRVDQQVLLRFDLANPRVRVEGTGRVAWADAFGQAGIEFLSLSQRSRGGLKEWIFVQILTIAEQVTRDSALASGRSDDLGELLFSSTSRPAIRLPNLRPSSQAIEAEAEEAQDDALMHTVHLPWLPFAVSPANLSRLVDGLILLSAMLLFAVIGIAMIGSVPPWPILLLLGCGVAGVFALLYRFLFLFWIGGTPGHHLARLTGSTAGGIRPETEERPRFR